MVNCIRYLFLLVFLLGSGVMFSQYSEQQQELLRKSIENFELLNINPEKAFKEAKEIEKESQKLNCKECELHSIRVQFRYYKRNNDFEKMIVTADLLSEKAKKYKECTCKFRQH